ncbi:MAG: dihydroorotase, partial [Bacteroidetes bacterium]|nr:dihydroorotase [Bacteroidota bacterium]
LLRYTGGKLHFLNISTPESVSLIRNAKSEGLNVTASVSIAQLYFNDTALEEFEGRYKLLPPLSNKTTQKVLLDALLEGTIDFIGSDHYNCSTEEKNVEFDLAEFGSRSNEHLFAALTELVGYGTACELLQRPYTFFGLEKPTLAQGSVATLSFFRKEPYRVTEKEPQTELFFGQQFDYKAQGIFSNGKLHLKTTH